MCGIAGYLGDFNSAILAEMGTAIAHRGPDGQGAWSEGRVGLAHARLAIIDLSPTGAQPMASADRRVVVSFNGEIYNFRELRSRLAGEGVAFRGLSDTEVLVELLARFGEKCLPWLNGIFAFAAWFPAERRMILVRDAAGVKPLYWARTAAGYAFASELKALRPVTGIDWSPDPAAIAAYLTLLYAPADLTPALGVRKLQPGEIMEWKDGVAPVIRRFAARPNEQRPHDLSTADAVEACRSYLQQAVRRQLVSDVPIGGFLSGGVDSTALAALAVKSLGRGDRYPCFTVASPLESLRGKEAVTDDFPYAQLAANRLGVPLHAISQESAAIQDVDRLVWMLDEPTPDPAAFMTYAISQQARAQGVKVLLSGAGGDDLFSGYRRHQALQSERLWGWWPKPLRAGLRQLTSDLSPTRPFARRLSKLFAHADAEPDERLASYFLWLGHEAMLPMLGTDFRAALGPRRATDLLTGSMAQLPEGVTRLSRMLHLDRSFFLASHNLNYKDKMGMACGVEIRVPLLDPDLASFAERLTDGQRIHGGETKYLFRRALRGVVPDEVLDRPKTGFGLPLRGFFHEVYGPQLRRLAAEGRLDATGVFTGSGVMALLEADRRGEIDATYPLLGVLCIESWLRQFAQR
jgi:asparagine synthase (glutamine-hydrolysing)